MSSREPRNDRELRAIHQAQEQEVNAPGPDKVELIPLNDGRIMIPEYDVDGNLINKTWGMVPHPNEKPDPLVDDVMTWEAEVGLFIAAMKKAGLVH
ncbi:hypothetical protein LJR153_007378 [Paenibacillus sp. LjRoot153]|uniref:hypothetical protein n=1 Tax=Paenibacillus sp. LjRoot153 TaxID=3342270 RepID=UPI003ECFBF65